MLDFTGDDTDKVASINGIIENESIGEDPAYADDNEWMWTYNVHCRHYMGSGEGDYPLDGPFTADIGDLGDR